MTVASFRAKVVEVITEVFDTLTSYIFRPGEAESAPLSEVEFGWLPEGMVEVFSESDEYFRYIRFENNTSFLIFTQEVVVDNSAIRDVEDSEFAYVETIPLHGTTANFTTNKGLNRIVWTTNRNIIVVQGNLSHDDILLVAEKIIFKS